VTVTITDPSNMKITIPRSRKGPTYGLLASALTPLAALFVPAPSFATTGDLTYEGCIANLGANGCEQPAHDSLREAVAVAVSRDDKSVYVGSGGAVTWFKRRSSGALVYKGCISHGRTLGCREDGHGSLNYVEDLAVSRDGKSVYAVAQFGNSITRFKRHRSGALTYKGCFANGGDHGCKEPRHESLGDASGVAMSRDGKSVYVVTFRGSITRFARRSNGALKYRGCFANFGDYGCKRPGNDALRLASGVTVSPNGKSVYVASSGAITRFDRSAQGALKYRSCIANQRQHECHALPAGSLRFARKVAASPDGSSVYVASYGGIIHFGRAPNGRLAYEGCIANRGARGCQAAVHDTLSAPYGLAISRDGESVYVSSVWDDAITAFRRGPDGTLTYGDCVANESDLGCEAAVHDSLDAAFGIAVSRDGRSVYVVAAGKADSITLFSRESSGP
jgi:DNA-binding beta-propeller fold protein YncE